MVFNEKILLKHPFDIHIITFVTGIIYEVRNIAFHSNVVILTTVAILAPAITITQPHGDWERV